MKCVGLLTLGFFRVLIALRGPDVADAPRYRSTARTDQQSRGLLRAQIQKPATEFICIQYDITIQPSSATSQIIDINLCLFTRPLLLLLLMGRSFFSSEKLPRYLPCFSMIPYICIFSTQTYKAFFFLIFHEHLITSSISRENHTRVQL